jgi:hypothetical protein
MSEDPDEEILIQIHRATANAVEVRAVSASDGLEISFSAPTAAAKADLERLARTKLAYVRSKRSAGQTEGADDPETPTDGRGGIIV